MNRTKKAMCDIFWQLLEEKAYNKITVQNIVERCQINRNTFYYHFKDIPDLAEYSIETWADQMFKNNFEFGSLVSCVIPIAQELEKLKSAFLHIYYSSHREAFAHYLDKISSYIVQSYIDKVTVEADIPSENKAVVAKICKCTFAGVLLDWLDTRASYNLPDFCEKACASFADSVKKALFGQ